MEVKASLKHLRMSAQKVRLVIDVVRKMPVEAALDQLKFINKKAAIPVRKLIKSAIANAVNTYDLDKTNLLIREIKADEGVTLKRWMPRAHGRASAIRKRGCHINVILAEIKDSGKKEKKVVKTEEPVKLEKLVKEGEKAAKVAGKMEKDKTKKAAAPEKAKMFRRKAG
ncbi:MAG: 50S ribosomal protein L22 [Patescibacteria group bacterium]